jgi:hypothetical protein
MRKPNVMAMLAMCFVCRSIGAANWTYLGTSGHGTSAISVDTSSIKVTGNLRRAAVKVTYPLQTQPAPPPNTGKWVSYLVKHSVFDCQKETYAEELVIGYFEDGSQSNLDEAKTPNFSAVPPGTVVNTEMKAICSWKPKKKHRSASSRPQH